MKIWYFGIQFWVGARDDDVLVVMLVFKEKSALLHVCAAAKLLLFFASALDKREFAAWETPTHD